MFGRHLKSNARFGTLFGDHWRGVPVMGRRKASNAWIGALSVGNWREYSERGYWSGVIGGEYP